MQKDTIKLLIKNGANVNSQDKQGDTPLHLASRAGMKQIVDILLDHNANPDVENKEGSIYVDTLLSIPISQSDFVYC